ncbi:hypothetical protein ANCCAN_18484 [Ancylostoma caninum]|uniref:Uncharacterized protein n=1 Tax=Ancylostoma caninum TaxID=29170 RepID=A0A368FW02_ANCCA|nr:hypothetical protein ANCCAN_18484 [Ancylostoma caninum]
MFLRGIWSPSDRPRFRDIQCLCHLILLLTKRSTVNWRNPVSFVSVDRVAVMSFRRQLSSFRDPTSDQLLPTPRPLPLPTPSQSSKSKLLKTALSNKRKEEEEDLNLIRFVLIELAL